jgi:hypothetical protein
MPRRQLSVRQAPQLQHPQSVGVKQSGSELWLPVIEALIWFPTGGERLNIFPKFL